MLTARHRRGLVPLSADPITFGHLDLIARAAESCDELIVAILDNDLKKGAYLFSIKERTVMAERAISEAGIGGVRVISDGGLLTDLYLREDCDAVFRGVRDEADKQYEMRLTRIHTSIYPPIEGRFVFLQAKAELDQISSTLVRSFVLQHLDVSKLVPAFVKRQLEERLVKQKKIGVTGGIAVGKSSVAKCLVERYAALTGGKAWHIDVDQLLRELYDEATPGSQAVREAIAAKFGADCLSPDCSKVNRAALAACVFSPGCDPKSRRELEKLTSPHVDRKFREALAGKEGLIVIEWAQLAEMSMGRWANHRVIVVDSPDRAKFAEKRGLTPERLQAFSEVQWSADKKAEHLQWMADKACDGAVMRYNNRLRMVDDDRLEDLDELAAKVAKLFPDR